MDELRRKKEELQAEEDDKEDDKKRQGEYQKQQLKHVLGMLLGSRGWFCFVYFSFIALV
jgi:hypothetical protein